METKRDLSWQVRKKKYYFLLFLNDIMQILIFSLKISQYYKIDADLTLKTKIYEKIKVIFSIDPNIFNRSLGSIFF